MTIEDIDNTEWLSQIAASMMAEAGLLGDISLHALSGGANNRVFRVDGNEHSALLKAYFQHPNDPRDRLTELSECTLFIVINMATGFADEFIAGTTMQPNGNLVRHGSRGHEHRCFMPR